MARTKKDWVIEHLEAGLDKEVIFGLAVECDDETKPEHGLSWDYLSRVAKNWREAKRRKEKIDGKKQRCGPRRQGL